MQDDQGTFFYHSNCRQGADGGLQIERQLLVEEQKLCRSRARKLSLENTRHRRALEEKQKQWDVQKQQLIEDTLKQRRQRVQDATERFQRAHLPPSQRRRQSFQRNVPSMEDALNQIRGSSSSFPQQAAFLSGNLNNIRICTPSPKPPTVSKPSHCRALSAVEASTKLLQDQIITCFKSSPQSEKTQEKQNNSPQGGQLSDCCNSESLSSKDSLENEDHSTKQLQYSYLPFLLDSDKPHPDLRKQNDLCPTSDLTSFSAMMLLGDDSARKRHEAEQKKQADSEGYKMHVFKASRGFAPKTQTQPTPHNCNFFTLCEPVSEGPEHFEVNSQNSPCYNVIATNRAAPGNAALDSSCPKQEALLGLRQNGVHDDRRLKHQSATEILLSAQNGNSEDILFGPPPKPIASINNLNKVSNSKPETEKTMIAASLQHACLSNIQSDALKCLKCPEEEAQNVPVPVTASHSVCKVRFITGILKKPSRYVPGDIPRMFGSRHLTFAKEVALAIRDSVELTRTKTKGVEGNDASKKKLRWFGEVHVENEDQEQNTKKQMKGKSSNLSHSNNNSEDHQLSLTTVSGASKPGPGMTPPASAGYHFTKPAWADVGVQVNLPQERADEVKVPRSSTRSGGSRVPRRECSGRAGGVPVSSRTRKGTVIQPQSATEVSRIAKTQGRIMVPRPPPRMEWEKTASVAKPPDGVDRASVNCKQALAEQAPHKDDSDGFFSPHTRDVVRTDSTVMYTPMPPQCAHSASKGNTKGTPGSGHQGTQSCSGRRRGMVCNDTGLCLDCTPTDEEILLLWHGVRSALATNEAETRLRQQALDDGRVVKKPCVDQNRQRPGSGNRRLPPPSQPTRQTTEPVTPFPSTYNMAFPYEGLVSAARLHRAEGRAGGLPEKTDIVAAVETAQTQRPGTAQRRQQQGLTTISLQEQNILLSLDRLNHQLYSDHFVQVGGNTGSSGLVLNDAPSVSMNF
ncbi:hypothetical protein VZT92_021013 [Zoarces viviparus]|uniref:Centrosomal protein of 126 kDa n=1 Tax=Zoarces viviparus TaxID=48416 RepID=A0AAW1EHP7_ZOAVI